ncbi:hypothetical protein JCM33374_g5471 [Metschnikowia sp. JCM 33374]|nr:hypothetical protein JCM33374_g5471 [Metschnikowia sp. JCM 33374]
MNVSKDAYFSAEYLKDRRYRSPRNIRVDKGHPIAYQDPVSRTGSLTHSLDSSLTRSSGSVSRIQPPKQHTENELVEQITPAELNYLHANPQKRKPPRQLVDYNDYYKPGANKATQKTIPKPTKENVATEIRSTKSLSRKPPPQKQPETLQYPYDAHDTTFFLGDDTSLYEPSLPNPQAFSGYYIDQQKRIDNSQDFKPSSYTHKTFKDVFQPDEDERLNPMDVVFDEPSKRSLSTKQKFARALKSAIPNFGKNDYEAYDYFQRDENEENDEPESLQVRSVYGDVGWNDTDSVLTNKYDIRSNYSRRNQPGSLGGENSANPDINSRLPDEYSEKNEENASTEYESPKPPTPRVKTKLRQKFRMGRKSSKSRGLINYGDGDFNEEASQSMQESVFENTPEPDQPEFQHSPEIAHGFNPLWNYVLSWLAYTNMDDTQPNIQGKITELPDEPENEPLSKTLVMGKSLRTHNTNDKDSGRTQTKSKVYKDILSKWNRPASVYISGEEKSERKGKPSTNLIKSSSVRAISKRGQSFEATTKHEVEEADEDEVQYAYNPKTGQLEPIGNQIKDSIAQTTQLSAANLHEGSPRTIISNVNKLIKSIRIMRIIFAPIDVVAENFPRIQTLVIFIELFIFVWLLYELSLLIDALCMVVKAVCAPMIAVGKFMNRIV